MITQEGKSCPSKQQEINTVTHSECLEAGLGLGYKSENETGERQWTGPGAFSACLVAQHVHRNANTTSKSTTVVPNLYSKVIVNPKPFETETNLKFRAICRETGIMKFEVIMSKDYIEFKVIYCNYTKTNNIYNRLF